jgi:hypothetical protein
MNHEQINKIDQEVKKADFNFLRALSDSKLKKRQEVVQLQIPRAYEMMMQEDTEQARRALLQLQAHNDAIFRERLRRFDAGR